MTQTCTDLTGIQVDRLYGGFPKPSARLVSLKILRTQTFEADRQFTNMMMSFGQFVDHDLTFTPVDPADATFRDGTRCNDTCVNESPCFPIQVTASDFYCSFGRNSCFIWFSCNFICCKMSRRSIVQCEWCRSKRFRCNPTILAFATGPALDLFGLVPHAAAEQLLSWWARHFIANRSIRLRRFWTHLWYTAALKMRRLKSGILKPLKASFERECQHGGAQGFYPSMWLSRWTVKQIQPLYMFRWGGQHRFYRHSV